MINWKSTGNLRTGKVYTAATHNIKDLPLEELGNRLQEDYANKDTHLANFCEHWKLASQPWFAEQLFATLAKVFNPGSCRSIPELLSRPDLKTPTNFALWALGTIDTRSAYIKQQSKSRFSALTPMILGSFKQFHNINYSEWEEEGLGKALDKHMKTAMNYDILAAYNALDEWDAYESGYIARLLELNRVKIDKDGPTLGSSRQEKLEYIRNTSMWYKDKFMSPETYHKIFPVLTPFEKAPWLIQVTVFQIWAAHPINRNTTLNILDFTNLDNVPEPLVFTSALFTKEVQNSEDRPW